MMLAYTDKFFFFLLQVLAEKWKIASLPAYFFHEKKKNQIRSLSNLYLNGYTLTEH